jgi:ferredoxin
VIPYLLVADLQNTALAAFLSFSGRVLYPTYAAAPRLWNISALDDQAAAGAIMWVPGSLAFLIPAALIAVQLLNARRGVRPSEFFAQVAKRPGLAMARAAEVRISTRLDARTGKRAEAPAPLFDLLRAPSIGTILRWPSFRRVAQAVMFFLALIVVADGLLGPQLSALNLAGVLPWTHWRGLVVITLLVAGNFFCMACPFILVRDLGRRILPGRWPWPGALRSKWLAVGLLAFYLWAYEAFSLWDSPWWTAWVVVGYFTAALTIDGLFKGASFCKYVCPIGQFNFVQSLASPLEIRVREPEVCATCATHDCIRGNAQQRGCELELYQPRKSGNMDCTFCLDCVKACPHDNVGILGGAPARDLTRDIARSSVGRFAQRPDLAALVLLLVFGAFINAAGMIAPMVKWQELMTAHFAFHSSLPVITTFMVLTLLVAPPLLALACGWWSRLLGSTPTHRPALLPLTCEFTMALMPLGLAMWAAHFILHLVVGADTLWPAVQRAAAGVGMGWLAVASPRFALFQNGHEWLPPLRLLLLDAGLLLSLYLVWRIVRRESLRLRSRLGAFVPWAGLASALFLAGVWISTQPMQTRVVAVVKEDVR